MTVTGLLDMCSIDPLGRNLPTAMIGYRPQKQDFLRVSVDLASVYLLLLFKKAV